MDCKFLLITPEMAESWLKTSEGNPRWSNKDKKVEEKNVKKIADDISSGKWNPGNNSIAFDEEGHLIDGHHRLSAVIMCGLPIFSLVVYGVPKSGLQHIDENRTRTISQRTGIDKRIVAVCNIDFWVKQGISKTCQSAEVVSEWAKNHPSVFDAHDISQKGSQHGVGRKAAVVHGIMCAIECGISTKTLEKFMESVNTGFTENQNQSSAIVLRNMLIEYKRVARRNSVQLSMDTQSAIFDYIKGVNRKRPYNSKNGIYSDILNN